MKSLLTVLVMAGLFSLLHAQPYGNEWIDINSEYLRIDVSQNALYKIDYSTLVNNGMTGTIVGSDLKLIARGNEVAMYVSENGIWDGDEILYFWGQKNDGWLDKSMYADPDWHHSDNYSTITDTISYFLTRATDGSIRKRLLEGVNDLSSPLPVAEDYFSYSTDLHSIYLGYSNGKMYKSYIWSDYSAYVNDTIESNDYRYFSDSNFTEGHGYVIRSHLGSGDTIALDFRTPYQSNNNLDCSISLELLSPIIQNEYEAPISISGFFNENTIFSELLGEFEYRMINASFTGLLSSTGLSQIEIYESELGYLSTDLYKASLTYNREYNLNADTLIVSFSLNSNLSEGHYLNFLECTESSEYVLLDSTNSEIYFLSTDSDSELHIHLPTAPEERKLLLIPLAQDLNHLIEVDSLELITFSDYEENSGNYIILTHPHFRSGPFNYLDFYAQNLDLLHDQNLSPVIIDVTKLYDSFGYGVKNHPVAIKNFIRYARKYWEIEPEFLFIIGTGVITRSYTSTFYPSRKNYVPTWGTVGCDLFLSSDIGSPVNALATGRLSITEPVELLGYFDKMLEYNNEEENNAWRQNILHLSRPYFEGEPYQINELNSIAPSIENSQLQGQVYNFPDWPLNQPGAVVLDDLIENDGVSIITNFKEGNFDENLWYLDHPSEYEQQGRYPLLLNLGHHTSNIFHPLEFSSTNLQTPTLFVNQPNAGAIGSLSFSYTFVNEKKRLKLAEVLYNKIGNEAYDLSIGEQMNLTVSELYHPDSTDYHMMLNNWVLLGDPAVRLRYVPPPVGIEEAELIEEIKITPNPFTDQVTLESESLVNSEIKIHDHLGKLIFFTHSSSNVFTWYGSTIGNKAVPSGAYQISIYKNNHLISTKNVLYLSN